mgnify:CR=1 FL=1|jgi:MFS family permease
MTTEQNEEERSSAIPWRSGVLYVILTSSLMGVMGVSLISPVLPELRSVFTVTDAQIGLIITAYTLPGIFLTPFIGLVADRIGRRRVIIPLLFLFGIAGGSISVVTSFSDVLILRFLQGVGASALVMLAVTLIGDFYEGNRRDAVMGFNASMVSAGAAFYPLVGGALAGIRWNVPFLFFGIGILIGLFALVALPEPPGTQSKDVRSYLTQLREAATHPHALAIFFAIFLIFFIFYGMIQTALPLFLDSAFALTSGRIGVVLATVALASAVVSSQYKRISKWRRAPELVALGFGSIGLSLLCVWLSPSPLLIGLSLLVFGAGFGVIMPSIETTIVTFASDNLRAGMMGLRTSMIRLGQTVGPVSFTYLGNTVSESPGESYQTLFFLFGSAIIVASAIVYGLLRR